MVGSINIKIDVLWEKSQIKLAKSDDILCEEGLFCEQNLDPKVKKNIV